MAREIGDHDLNKQQKFRALRIDHVYYAKAHPWRTLMKTLSIVLPVIGLGFLAFMLLFPNGANIYMPGPVTTKHQIFAERCNECHEEVKDPKTGKMLFGAVTDTKCSHCHDGPIHHANQVYPHHIETIPVSDGKEIKEVKYEAPGCATCHTEHASNTRLTEIADRHCTQCHIDLKVNTGTAIYKSGVAGFINGHPEFAAKRPETQDKAQVFFNHAKHIGTDSSVKKEDGSKLECIDCHKPDAQRAYMAQISYEHNCKTCHKIEIPPVANIGKVVLPHAEPSVVSAVAKTAFSEYLLKNGGKPPAVIDPHIKELEEAVGNERNPAKKKKLKDELEKAKAEGGSKADPRTPEQWQKENVAATLKPLFFPDPSKMGASCFLCHVAQGKEEGTDLPKVAPTNIPAIWFKHAKFNHETHRVLLCAACHTAAAASSKTEDVLLPGIDNCKTCHMPSGARSGCNECHAYHDKSHPKVQGVLTLDKLKSGTLDMPHANTPEPAPAPAGTAAPASPASDAAPVTTPGPAPTPAPAPAPVAPAPAPAIPAPAPAPDEKTPAPGK